MPSCTADLNADPRRCDAFHEAGHAVIAVVRGLRLTNVTGVDAIQMPPHCDFDHSEFEDLLDRRPEPGVQERIRLFTEHHAEMCLASHYSEAIACDTSSDEQKDALHCDYLDAERVRYTYLQNYFGLLGIKALHERARDLVAQYQRAITRVAEELLDGHTLNQDQVLTIVTESEPELM